MSIYKLLGTARRTGNQVLQHKRHDRRNNAVSRYLLKNSLLFFTICDIV